MSFLQLRDAGVWVVLRDTAKGFSEHDLSTYAAALAYRALFSIFPFILFLLALLGFLHLPSFFGWLREQAALLLPPVAMEQVDPVIDQLQQSQGGLMSVGILLALWTASIGIRSLMNAMNRVYQVEESRPGWKLILLSVALIYYATPDVEQDFRFITPGSVVAVIIWLVASIGFGIYVQNFANYNATYGSIGAIIVLLLYFYISAAVLLLGAQLNATIEHASRAGKDVGEKQLDE